MDLAGRPPAAAGGIEQTLRRGQDQTRPDQHAGAEAAAAGVDAADGAPRVLHGLDQHAPVAVDHRGQRLARDHVGGCSGRRCAGRGGGGFLVAAAGRGAGRRQKRQQQAGRLESAAAAGRLRLPGRAT